MKFASVQKCIFADVCAGTEVHVFDDVDVVIFGNLSKKIKTKHWGWNWDQDHKMKNSKLIIKMLHETAMRHVS